MTTESVAVQQGEAMRDNTSSRREILQLKGIDSRRSLAALIAVLGVLVAAFALFCAYPSIWTFALAFLVIAARQHALLIVLHECWHGLFVPDRKANHLLGQLIGYAVGSKYWLARQQHLDHHRKLGSTDDPDRSLHSSSDKATRRDFARYFVGRVLGGQLRVSHQLDRQDGAAPALWAEGELRRVAAAQGFVWLGLTLATGYWWIYFALWALPLATATTLFNSVRAFTEHAVAPQDEPAEPSRDFSVLASPLERFFFAPLCFHCHAEHHLFPTIPYHRLPRVRALILANRDEFPGYSLRPGYLSFLASYYHALPD